MNSAAAGGGPYSATVLALQGQVPSGNTLLSPDDPNLRAAVVSRWADGSAAVLVLAGSVVAGANESRNLRLQLAAPVAGEVMLGASRVASSLTSVTLDCGALGSANLNNFETPERVWWATPQNVCARYRVPVSGHATLEMVVDIHAYAGGRAFVEVVVENCKMMTASPTRPGVAAYTGAVLSVNGVAVNTVSAAGAAEGTHSPFRAWYASTWVGGSDPGLRMTQAAADLQAHPLLFKVAKASTSDLGIYAGDTYTPWAAGRHRASNMGGAGDHASIGPLPLWEARALQSGDARAWRAVEANALAIVGFGINYRDTSSGLVPSLAAIGTRWHGDQSWPSIADNGRMGWEVAHHPAVGLMAFVSRPSPVFIELAQKVAVWNGTWSANATPKWAAGTHGYWYQVRGRAWCLRSLAHATFLTPDGDAWKASGRTALANNVAYLDSWRTDPKFALGVMCDQSPGDPADHEQGTPGFHQAVWEHHYMVTEIHKVASANLLTGAAQAALQTLADWCAAQPVRFVNEQPNGGWRYVPYKDKLGDSPTTIGSLSTWTAERNRAGNYSDTVSSVSGPWMSNGGAPSTYASYTTDPSAGAYYPSYFWAALAAARERGIAGASQAWATVQANITNQASWLNGFGNDPRWGAVPRNL